MKRVRFWGTRGSLPIALTAPSVRAKLVAALRGAAGRELGNDAVIERYLGELPFHAAATYGGHASCVEIETGSTCSATWAAGRDPSDNLA